MDLQHLSTTCSPVERPKKTATRRMHDDNARSESDVGKSIATTRNVLNLCFHLTKTQFFIDGETPQQTPERPPVDWSDDEGGESRHCQH